MFLFLVFIYLYVLYVPFARVDDSNMKVVYMFHGGLKIGGLGSGPILKMGGFQNWPTRETLCFGTTNNKTHTHTHTHIYKTQLSPNSVTDYLFCCFLPISLLYYRSSGINMATVSHGDDVSNVAFLSHAL